MSKSRAEEIISALWGLCAITSFGFGFSVWGWIFTIKAAIDVCCSIYFAVKEKGFEFVWE